MDGTASVAAARASPRRRQLPPRPPSCVLVEAATAGEDDERDLGTGAGPRHVLAQGRQVAQRIKERGSRPCYAVREVDLLKTSQS